MLDETLKKTLPEGGLSLPDTLHPEEKLSFALKDLADLAKREGKVAGLAGTTSFFEQRGITPEDLPGSSVAQMISFVDSAMVDPVHKRAEAVGDILNAISVDRARIQETALNQMNMMMGHGVWNEFMDSSPSQAKELWSSSGMTGDPYKIPTHTPGKWDHIEIIKPEYGFTLDETHDLYHNTPDGRPPVWFIERDMLPNLTEQEIKEFLSFSGAEIKSMARDSGKDDWDFKTPSKVTDSPKFQNYIQEQWELARRSMGRGLRTDFSEGISGPSAALVDAAREEMKDETFKNTADLKVFLSDFNKRGDFGVTAGELTTITNLLRTEMPIGVSSEEVPFRAKKLYDDIIEYLEEEGIKPNRNVVIEEVERWFEQTAVQGNNINSQSREDIIKYIEDKYFGGYDQQSKANSAKYILGAVIPPYGMWLAAKKFEMGDWLLDVSPLTQSRPKQDYSQRY